VTDGHSYKISKGFEVLETDYVNMKSNMITTFLSLAYLKWLLDSDFLLQ